jgi:beta-lactamase class A
MRFKAAPPSTSIHMITLLLIILTATIFAFIFFHNKNILVKANNKLITASPRFEKVITPPKPMVPIFSTRIGEIVSASLEKRSEFFGIYIKNLTTGEYYYLHENEQFTAASLYKLSVMYTIYKLANQGKLNLKSSSIKNNLKSMITVSSNEAALGLVNTNTTFKEVTNDAHALGMSNTNYAGSPLITTPLDIGKLLSVIAAGQAISLDYSVAMLDLMSQQKRVDRIPALLPDEAIVANKTGELDDFLHDAAVIGSPKNTYIMVIMTKNDKVPESVKPTFAKISQQVYDYFENESTVSAKLKN